MVYTVPRKRISAPSSGGLSVTLSVPDPVKENSNCFSSGLKVILSAAPLNFLNDPEPINGVEVAEAPSPVTLIRPDPGYLGIKNTGKASPEIRTCVPSSGGFAANISLPDPVKEKSICFSKGFHVADSAAPDNFLSEPDPIYVAGVIDSAPVPVILIRPEPGWSRLNNVYA